MLPKIPNITYINYNWGDKFSPVVVPEVRQVPMLAFYPPQIQVSQFVFRPKTVSEFQAYILDILTNEPNLVDQAWVAQTLDNTQSNVLQGGLVYMYGKSFGLYTGTNFTYALPSPKMRPGLTIFPEEFENASQALGPLPDHRDPRVKIIQPGTVPLTINRED